MQFDCRTNAFRQDIDFFCRDFFLSYCRLFVFHTSWGVEWQGMETENITTDLDTPYTIHSLEHVVYSLLFVVQYRRMFPAWGFLGGCKRLGE